MNLYKYAEDNPVNWVDPFGLWVGGVGIGGGVSYWIGSGSGDISYMWDGYGNRAIILCYGSGAGFSRGAGGYLGGSSTNAWGADTVCDMAGGSWGGSIGRAGAGGGTGPAITVSGGKGGVNINTGGGVGAWGAYGGWGECKILQCWGDCCNKKQCEK